MAKRPMRHPFGTSRAPRPGSLHVRTQPPRAGRSARGRDLLRDSASLVGKLGQSGPELRDVAEVASAPSRLLSALVCSRGRLAKGLSSLSTQPPSFEPDGSPRPRPKAVRSCPMQASRGDRGSPAQRPAVRPGPGRLHDPSPATVCDKVIPVAVKNRDGLSPPRPGPHTLPPLNSTIDRNFDEATEDEEVEKTRKGKCCDGSGRAQLLGRRFGEASAARRGRPSRYPCRAGTAR